MLRMKLIEQLTTISPGLSQSDIVPVLTHFWLKGNSIMTYNDQIAMSIPFETGIEGAVPGSLLLSLLKATIHEKLIFEINKNYVEINAIIKEKRRKLNLKLKMIPPDDYMFKMPKLVVDHLKHEAVKKKFIHALKGCMRSVATHDPTQADQLGITLIPAREGRSLRIYATNDSTISCDRITSTDPILKKRTILSRLFCEQLIALAGDKPENIKLQIDDKQAVASAGDVTLYGKYIETKNPLDFEKITNRVQIEDKRFVSIPKGMLKVLDRAIIMADAGGDSGKQAVKLSVGESNKPEAKSISFYSKCNHGEIRERLSIGAAQEDIEISVSPKMLKIGCEEFEHWAITDNAIVMKNGDAAYMISVHNH